MIDYIFLSGIHEVGKSTLANKINNEFQIFQISVSDLIRQTGKKIGEKQKNTSDITNNQLLWKNELNNLPVGNKLLILDGHFSLLDKTRKIVPLSFSTFDGTNMKKIILKKENPKIIQERLSSRDGVFYSVEELTNFQQAEEERANSYSKISSIPIFTYDSDAYFYDLIKFIQE